MSTHLRFNITTPLGQAGAADLRDQIVTALAPLGITVESVGAGLDMNVYLQHQSQAAARVVGHVLHELAGPADCVTCQGIRDAAIRDTVPVHRSRALREADEAFAKLDALQESYRRQFPDGRLGPPREDDRYHPNGPGFIPGR